MTRIQTPLFCISRAVRTSLALAIAAALSACGGGGGSSSGTGTGTTGTGSTGTGSTGTGTGSTSTTPRWAAVASASAAPTAPTAVLAAPPVVTVTTNDALFGSQGHLTASSLGNETANIAAAWTVTTGATHNIVVAVVDTGIESTHPDLVGKVLPGYNFRADPVRNTDTTPHGPVTCNGGGTPTLSHGTTVAGTIAANANNSIGVAGIHWGAKVLPVRVNDGCTGSSTDLIDAIRWSAGLTVAGVPANNTPAKVINISQAGAGNCPSNVQSAIDDAIAVGAIIVAGAGNSGGAVYYPANCAGVITMTMAVGSQTATGPEVDLSSKANAYTTYTNGNYGFFGGTSAVTPIASGVVALILSIAPNLNAESMRSVLMASARAYPLVNPYTNVTYTPALTGLYGAGYLDAWRAIKYVQSMLLAQIGTAAVANNGSAMLLNSTTLVTGGGTVSSYAWSQVSGAPVSLSGTTTASAGVVFPAGAGTYVFKLVVTDSLGRSSSAVQTVVVGA